ncbi:hypothetical protein Acid345_4280 [Candidatus Koribacter versatilis Ellin345]|uniref:GmrSD restriction endonucleases N-terminal domain-containing protein n=2 Tax=Candidatus Korobacter versatilis TaxID=658062 RepID=Q1IIM0_KORVE|nr:hypothetical protein Acid345_4280 [Candidatus Koribacter versatilis Ellin345]
MRYKNSEMKLDQFVNYVNDDKINLIPPFQRYHVWGVSARRKLLTNIVQGRPIPAIFLYRDAAGDKYAYNILDGKQRLESIIMFIGDKHASLKVNNPKNYFAERKYKDAVGFKIDLGGKKKQGLEELGEDLVRDLREYVIPTIEITLDQDNPSALDEIINLFVDINSTGEPVKRFAIVRAMSKDRLLNSVRMLISRKEQRQNDWLYFPKKNEFTQVLQTMQIIIGMRDRNSKADRMWEMLVEFAMFLRTKEHRNPVDILKGFIRAAAMKSTNPPLTTAETTKLSQLFSFIRKLYVSDANFRASRLAVNQIHFYTMVTTIIGEDLLTENSNEGLAEKLKSFAAILEGRRVTSRQLSARIRQYQELSEKQTTHVGRRESRQIIFKEVLDAL